MYLHLGHNNNTEIREIIGIFDLTTCQSSLFKNLLPSKKKPKIKSCVLTSNQILPSSIASTTLFKRCEDVNELIRE